MKQTQSAIKFLMAQYRAIFKHAFFKGLVTATVLTAGMAAGANNAQASVIVSGDNWEVVSGDITLKGDKATADTDYSYLQLSNAAKTLNHVLTFTSGKNINSAGVDASNTNHINSTDGTATGLTGTGGLVINTGEYGADDLQQGLSIHAVAPAGGPPASQVTIDLDKGIKLNSGYLSVFTSGASSEVNLLSDITVGDGEGRDTKQRGILHLGGKYSDGQGDGSGSPVDNSGSITVGKAATSTEAGTTLDVKSDGIVHGFGIVDIKSQDVSFASGSKLRIYHDNNTLYSGNVSITSHNVDFDGELSMHSGASLTIKLDNTKLNESGFKTTEKEQGVMSIGANANLRLGGTLTISGGTVSFDQNAKIYAEKATGEAASSSGAIVLSGSTNGSDTNAARLEISSAQIKSFLNGTGSDVETSKLKSGSILVSGNLATLAFTEDSVDLYALTSGAGAIKINESTSGENTLTLSGGAFIEAKNLTVSASGDKLNLGNAHLVALDTLTLGSNSYVDSGVGANKISFSAATTKNLTFLAKDYDFELGSAITLQSTRDITDENGKPILDSDTGTINGNFTLTTGGEINVNGGVYSADQITMSGGELNVTNSLTGTTADFESSLTVDTLVLTNTNSSILVSGGSAQGRDSVLTIDDIYLGTGNNASGSIIASGASSGKGIINLDASDVQEILDYAAGRFASNNNTSPIQIIASGNGIVNIDGSITFKYEHKADGTENDYSLFTALQISGGTVTADGVTVNSTGADGDDSFAELRFGGTLEVNELSANVRKLDGSLYDQNLKLVAGNVIVNSALNSQNDTINVIGDSELPSNASLQFGNIEAVYEANGTDVDHHQASTSGGSVNVENLIVSNADTTYSGSVQVLAGAWTGNNVTVSGGTMSVGSSGGESDANDQTITASFSGDKLTVASTSASGAFTVNQAGSATFVGLDAQKDGGINVYGSLTVNGGEVTAEDKSKEVKLASGSIVVNSNANLTFGQDALANSIMSGSAVNTTLVKDAIVSEANSMVTLDFASGSFTIDQLTAIKKDLFYNEDSNGKINGVLNIGNAAIGDLNIESGSIAWSDYKGVADVASDVTSNKLLSAKVTGVDSAFKGNVGSVESTNQRLDVDGNVSFNNAAGNDGLYVSYNGTAASVYISNGSNIKLSGGGTIGDISLNGSGSSADDGAVLLTAGEGTTTISNVTGDDASEFTAAASQTIVEKNVNVGDFNTEVGSSTQIKGNLTADKTGSTTEINGVLSVGGNFTTSSDLDIGAKTSVSGNLTAEAKAGVYADTLVAGTANLKADFEVAEGSLFKAKSIVTASSGNRVYSVGEDDYTENGQQFEGTTGYLEAESFQLNGNTLVIDPAYGKKTSIAAIKSFSDSYTVEDAGVVDGTLIVGKNAGLMLGTNASVETMQQFLAQYQDASGSLKEDEVGAVFYLTDKLTVEDNISEHNRIIIDSTRSKNEILGTSGSSSSAAINNGIYSAQYKGTGNNVDADLYIGSNSILAVGDNTLSQGSAIHFNKGDAYIMAKDASSKIVLVGDKFLNSRNITLFTDNGTGSNDTGVKVLGTQDIRVESLNGLMYFTLEHGTETSGESLELDITQIDNAYLGASAPMRDFLVAYASKTNNWDKFYDASNQGVEREYLVDKVASKSLATADDSGNLVLETAATNKGYTEDDFTVVNEGTKEKPNYVVYHLAHNTFLEKVVRDTDGAAADQAGRSAALGGAMQAAVAATTTTTDAISGRMGVGAANATLTYANNGQGAGLWVTPVYRSSESDGFSADGVSTGADISLYGLALGGDFTMSNGLRLGAMFNLGSGDADGQGIGSVVSNDFDYYGFGLYAGYSLDKISVVGDVTYTSVDNSVDANTAAGKVTASTDTTALSFGVTGQYALDVNGLSITPHAGLRYTMFDMDDYSFNADGAEIGAFDADKANVFSIPVGVTFAKEITAGSWTVKPSFDLTLTANMGDDQLDGKVSFAGVSNRDVATTTEFIDNFTYGATLGVAAQSGNMSVGFGVNYTGSSNTDEYGVQANARFVF